MDFKDKALKIIADLADTTADKLSPEMELVADLNIDSPKALQLLVELEDQLNIEISDEDAALLDSVGDILSYLDRAVPA